MRIQIIISVIPDAYPLLLNGLRSSIIAISEMAFGVWFLTFRPSRLRYPPEASKTGAVRPIVLGRPAHGSLFDGAPTYRPQIYCVSASQHVGAVRRGVYWPL